MFPLKMVIFHSYVSLPEGMFFWVWNGTKYHVCKMYIDVYHDFFGDGLVLLLDPL